MAVKVQQVLEILEQIAPPELACSWDNVGLLVDAGRPVTSIMTALDITADVVRDAAESGCELIVSHHPVIFDPLRRVTAEDVPAMLLQNGISAICMHTNLDAAPGGVNDVLADLLRIENRRDFADNCGRIGTLNVPTTAQQLAETCSRMLHTHCKFVEADGLYDVLAVSQDVVCDSPGKQRVTLEYGQAVPYALTDTAFLGSFQPRLDSLNALGWLHGVHGVF